MKNILFFLIFSFSNSAFPQNLSERQRGTFTENHAKGDARAKNGQFVRVVFYNLENLYDPYDDTTTLDDEFTSKGAKRWTYSKFIVKLEHLSKTFLAIGGWDPPAMIGVCEIENRYVLNKLIYDTPLKKFKYRFVHYNSTDVRGIDVAFLYRPDRFRLLFSRNISIRFPSDSILRTRDILYIKGILFQKDTLNIFINHWPSRRGGFTESVPKRLLVAKTLRSCLDSLQQKHPAASILIMGDFNDDPDQPSIRDVLGARAFTLLTKVDSLVNLMLPKMNHPGTGTHKFQGKWAILDQFIVSGALLLNHKGLHTSMESANIFSQGFLLEEDERALGVKPSRTYSGPRYLGGFSDHLPVYLDLWDAREQK
jgi:predicted extracellular nuclease